MFPTLKAYLWQIVAGLLVLLLIVQTVRIEGFLVWPIGHKGLKRELVDMTADRDRLQGEVDRLTEEGEAMRKVSAQVVVKWRTRLVERRKAIADVESAPLPGNCRTPDGVTEKIE